MSQETKQGHGSRSERIMLVIAVLSLIVAGVGTLFSGLTVREIRDWLRLDHGTIDRPSAASSPSTVSTPAGNAEGNYTDIEMFTRTFRATVTTGDMRRIADFVNFPFDEQMNQMTRAQFIANYEIGPDMKRIIGTSPLTKHPGDLSYTINSMAFAITFKKDFDGYWKWTSVYYGE